MCIRDSLYASVRFRDGALGIESPTVVFVSGVSCLRVIRDAQAAFFRRHVDSSTMAHGCPSAMPAADPLDPRCHHHREGQPASRKSALLGCPSAMPPADPLDPRRHHHREGQPSSRPSGLHGCPFAMVAVDPLDPRCHHHR